MTFKNYSDTVISQYTEKGTKLVVMLKGRAKRDNLVINVGEIIGAEDIYKRNSIKDKGGLKTQTALSKKIIAYPFCICAEITRD